MKRMKTFFIYLLLVLAVVLLTDIIAKLVLETNYKDITNYEISTTSPEIKIEEAKTTRVNGKIKGTVTNKSENFMEDVFIKVELKSKTGHTLGTEYVKMGNFQPEQNKEFSLNYKYSDVTNFVISTTNYEENTETEIDPFIENVRKYYPIARLVAWCVTPAIYFLPLFLFTGR